MIGKDPKAQGVREKECWESSGWKKMLQALLNLLKQMESDPDLEGSLRDNQCK